MGREARGIADDRNLPDRWSATENVAWKTDLPGRAWASPIVWGDQVFLTRAVASDELEAPEEGPVFWRQSARSCAVELQYQVTCLALSSGDKVWERTVHQGTPNNPIHLKNSFASETPVTDGQHVYAYFGNQGLYCLDLQGKPVWSKPFQAQATRFGWGTAASPVLYEDHLFIVNDNEEQSYLLCLDKRTGEQVWRIARDEGSNWSTPFIWQNDQRTEIVTLGTDKVRSYDLEGNLLWWLTGMSSITIATPYVDHGLLYISSGYVGDRHRPLYAIRAGASGDISLQPEQVSNEFIAWCQPTAAPYNPTTLVYEGRVYVLYDRGLFGCYHAQTGQPLFEPQRIPQGRHFTASPWACNGKVFCLNEDGVTFVFRAGDDYELLHTNKLADDDMCMATPAIAGDRLLIRTSARLLYPPGGFLNGTVTRNCCCTR